MQFKKWHSLSSRSILLYYTKLLLPPCTKIEGGAREGRWEGSSAERSGRVEQGDGLAGSKSRAKWRVAILQEVGGRGEAFIITPVWGAAKLLFTLLSIICPLIDYLLFHLLSVPLPTIYSIMYYLLSFINYNIPILKKGFAAVASEIEPYDVLLFSRRWRVSASLEA